MISAPERRVESHLFGMFNLFPMRRQPLVRPLAPRRAVVVANAIKWQEPGTPVAARRAALRFLGPTRRQRSFF
jgi:hypothetical protein